MKVLFVSSGNSGDIGILVKNQGESLRFSGIEVEYFLISGKGFWSYIKSIPKIRRVFKEGTYSLVHAHYSLSAFAASLAGSFPLVVSLMGSDAYLSRSLRFAAKIFSKLRWNATIVKSQRMKDILGMKNAFVIPNGVDLNRFVPVSKVSARGLIGFDNSKKIILFIANPERPEKNFKLALASVKELKNPEVKLISVFGKPNEEINYYLNAAAVLLLTSKWEGSVNVIKEAMACNCPIVSTDVGDVRHVIGNTEGCYISNFEPEVVADKMKSALQFSKENGRTKGRERIIELGLDSETIAMQIISVYNKVIEGRSGK